MCEPVSCDKPVPIPGHCCPKCQTQALNCDLHCPQGFKKDSFGSDICECIDCINKQNDCILLCPLGYKRADNGCEICECRTNSYDLNAKDEDKSKPEFKNCISTNGTIHENGHYWHDGCRECICNNAKIMCTKPQCPPINCFNSIVIDGQCCPTCSVQDLTKSSEFLSFNLFE